MEISELHHWAESNIKHNIKCPSSGQSTPMVKGCMDMFDVVGTAFSYVTEMFAGFFNKWLHIHLESHIVFLLGPIVY